MKRIQRIKVKFNKLTEKSANIINQKLKFLINRYKNVNLKRKICSQLLFQMIFSFKKPINKKCKKISNDYNRFN